MPTETPSTIRKETIATERMLAEVRLILWLASAVISMRLGPSPGGAEAWLYRAEQGGGPEGWLVACLGVFFAYSLGMWLIVRYFPQMIRTAVLASSFSEVVLITALIWATYVSWSPFYLWYVFYVVSISLRYGLQVSILALAASVMLYTIVAMFPSIALIYVPGFVGSTAFLFVLAFLFGHMSERQRSYQARLAVVNELGIALASLSTSREIVRLLVAQTAGLLGAEICWFVPHPDGAGTEVRPAPLGIADGTLDELTERLGDWSPDRVLERRQTLVSNDPRRDSRLPSEAWKLLPVKSLAAVPLYVREVPVGLLYAADKQPRGFSGYDIELLELIAVQAAPIIENIRLWERLKEAAASEERLRIARDLHDSFLQTLSAIKLYLERCKLLIDKDPDKAKASVERLHDISTQGLADVRSYLSELRLMGPEPSRFKQAAERCAVEAASRGGFVVHTQFDVPEDALTPRISLAAFQILRELLTNVVKHASAANAWVAARCSDESLDLEVRDDGVGFDLAARRPAGAKDHLGLVGVEERVKELGGRFEITSTPGGGTSARIALPVSKGQEEAWALDR